MDEIIKTKCDSFSNSQIPTDSNNKINFFVNFFNINSFTTDARSLSHIVKNHVKPTDSSKVISVIPYFRPYRISSVFSTRPKTPVLDRSDLVYVYQCPEQHCSASYVGYTTNSLATRVKQHRYSSSSIYKNYAFDHSMLPPSFDSFKTCFSIFYSNNNLISIKIAEAIKIKADSPKINVKYNELFDFLKLF